MFDKEGSIEEKLKAEIFDQDYAIERVFEALSKATLLEKNRVVRALFSFIGSPNCGKHYLAQKLVEHDESLDQLKIFHMDWYAESDKNNASSLIESEIAAFVDAHPRSVLMFEDIEKAELQVQLVLFALFSDRANSAIDFSQSVIIFTTTRASGYLAQSEYQTLLSQDRFAAHTYIMERLAKEQIALSGMTEQAFDGKLLSLMNQNSVIGFQKLKLSSLIKIGARALHEMSQNFLHQSEVEVEYEAFDKIATLLTLSLAPYLNAKHIKEKLPEVMFGHIYKGIQLQAHITKVTCRVGKEALEFANEHLEDSNKLLKQLRDQHNRVLLSWDYKVKNDEVICEITQAAFTKEHYKLSDEEAITASDISFDDIAGHEKVKKELMEVVALLNDPTRLEAFNMPMPKGMVLHGVAHIGKKMLARAFAKAVDRPYISISQADLFDENKVHKVYEQAKNFAPSIVIIEDLDIQGIMGGMVSPVPVSPFIAELDALAESLEPQVFTIATITKVGAPQEALVGAGYLTLSIEVPKLDMQARRFFIEKVLKMPNDGKIDVDTVVRYISGMDGKELQKIVNDAALYVAKTDQKVITQEILLEQINIIKYGLKLENRQMRDIEKSMETTAYHEAGHAVLSYYLMPEVKIEQVTVAPRSEALGFVSYNNEEYIDASSKADLIHNICVLLAGRMVTLKKYGDEGMETGASNDLEVASMQIYAAIAIYGMDEVLGNISISGVELGYNKELFTKQIEERMLVWLDQAKAMTQEAVEKYWNAIVAVASVLIEKEMIDGEELKEIILSKEGK